MQKELYMLKKQTKKRILSKVHFFHFLVPPPHPSPARRIIRTQLSAAHGERLSQVEKTFVHFVQIGPPQAKQKFMKKKRHITLVVALFFWGGRGWGDQTLRAIRFSVFPNISEKKFSPAAGLNQ